MSDETVSSEDPVADAPADEPVTEDTMIAGLLREREGYLQRGMDDRVAQVDEQLRIRGHEPSAQPSPQSGDGKTPRGRRAPGQSTA